MPDQDQETLLAGFSAHQSGDYPTAEASYRRLLQRNPNHLDACQLLGALLVQTENSEEAVNYLNKAIQQNGQVPQYHVNLGAALSRLGRREEAASSYRTALSLDPGHADAHKNLGFVLCKLKRFEEAIPHLEQFLLYHPSASVEAKTQLAMALVWVDRKEEAIPIFEELVERQPDDTKILSGFAQALLGRKKPDERGVELWKRLIDKKPENKLYLTNLASLQKSLERYDEAEATIKRALEIDPDFVPALCNLGLILAGQSMYVDAKQPFEKAIRIWRETGLKGLSDTEVESTGDDIDSDAPDDAKKKQADEHASIAYTQLAAIENLLGNYEAALDAVECSLEIDDNPDGQLTRGFIRLGLGKYADGWRDYEIRTRTDFAPRLVPGERWQGQADAGKTVLIHCEQGLGDTFHFVRYAKLVKERVGRVVFVARPPTIPILESYPFIDEIVEDGKPFPNYDWHVPLMSLPYVFETTLETIPSEVPYLTAESSLVSHWKEKLADLPGLKVGICWQGNKDFAYDRYRSVGLKVFERISLIKSVSLVSLQIGEGLDELENVEFDVKVFEDLDKNTGPFMDTAALISNLDLVISSDTAVPHLAGALGVPVWLATSAAPEWRWLTQGSDCPWYPKTRLFRQAKLEEWEPVFEKMAEELSGLTSGSN